MAEDLFQDTWLAAARHAHRLHEGSQLLPWLYTIARNKHHNAFRMRVLALSVATLGACSSTTFAEPRILVSP